MPKVTNLGRVTFVYVGEFVPNTAYKRLDLVSTDTALFAAIRDVPAGIPITDRDYFRDVFDISEYINAMSWYSQIVGAPFALLPHLTNITPPQLTNCKFIKLSYNDSYNNGLLTEQTATVDEYNRITATGKINLSNSPIHGKTINLINTDRRFLRPGDSSGILEGDAIRNITGAFTGGLEWDPVGTGAFRNTGSAYSHNGGIQEGSSFDFDASRVVPTASENRPTNMSAVYFMRIL